MFTLDWHQLRGLALLAILGLFVLHFVVTGLWLNLRDRQRSRPLSAQDQPPASGAVTSNGIERRSAEAQPDLHVAACTNHQVRRAA